MKAAAKMLENFQRNVLGKVKENITKDLLLTVL